MAVPMNPTMCSDDPIYAPSYEYCDKCDELAAAFTQARAEAVEAAADAQEFAAEAQQAAETAAADVENALVDYVRDGEAWAIGERDGTPVEESDDTYQNNAKYYKDVTETIATSASDSESHAAQSATQASNSATAAQNAQTAAQNAQAAAEAAAEAAASVFSVVGNVTFTVLENGQVREIWTKEE